MLHRDNLRIFWLQWMMIHILCLGISFSLPGFIRDFGGDYSGSFELYPPTTLTCIIAAVFLGAAQWFFLRNRFPRLHHLWIVTAVIGLSIGAYLIAYFQFLTAFRLFHENPRIRHLAIKFFINGALGGFVGGLLIGSTQCLVVGKQIGWIIMNAVAWSFAWATALAGRLILNVFSSVILSIDLSSNKLVQLIMLGSILGFMSSLLTGAYLVWLLKRSDV